MPTKFWSENLKERSLGRPRCKWEANIRTDLRQKWYGGVKWIHVVHDKDQ